MRNGEAIDLVELINEFGDDQKCRNYLEALRWHDAVRCPKCGGDKISSILKRDQHNCDNEECRYQFSVTAGTIFHDTHLPLCKWFLATYLICQSRKGMSANQIKRMLGVSYKTAWYLCHRIRAAMAAVPPRTLLDGTVEVDETWVGGREQGRGMKRRKEIVIGIRQRNEGDKVGELRFFHAQDVKSGTLAKYIRENVSTETVDVIMTDDYPAYPKTMIKAGIHKRQHRTVNHSKRVYVEGDVHTNTVESAFSLLKRGVIGTWHRISAKHLEAYLNEMCFRFNNRKNPFLFRDTLKRMLASDNLEFKTLTSAA
jgi:transposase-like protein